jgi:hypothetical protein
LAGLTNKYNIWASTLDKADVDVMHDRIENGANLLKEHCFQFDFLNDDFEKLPKNLRNIINNKKLCKKLIIYINPPYAENTSYGEKSKKGLSKSKAYEKYKNLIGNGINEICAQFFMQIYSLIPDVKLASFSKLKYVNSQNFIEFRKHFLAEYKGGFVCRANTFDNVKGEFPIGFLFWDTAKKEKIERISVNVFDKDGNIVREKIFFSSEKGMFIIDWLRKYFDKNEERIAYLRIQGTDFQTNNTISIASQPTANDIRESKITNITKNNLIPASIYFSVRHCIPADWLNDRDQFLYPDDGWKTDFEFQNDCLAYTLFHGQNNISSKHGANHWIPFTEKEVNAHEKFDSHFMLSFIGGKIIQNGYSSLFEQDADRWCIKRKFSPEAAAVFNAGRELWKYYHTQPKCNINASLYDVREHFQGRNEQGKMNNKSDDETYNELIGDLREKLKILAKKIEPKVYEYGFLRG